MRTLIPLLSFFLVASAFNISDYLYEGENATVAFSNFSFSMGNFSIVKINGTETFLINRADMSLVENASEIENILTKYYIETYAPKESDINELRELIMRFNASREPEEGKCRSYTGTEAYKCYDRETCAGACLHVPLCRDYLMGAGEYLLLPLFEWRNNTARLDARVGSFLLNLKRVNENITFYIGLMKEDIAEINTLTERIRMNKLFRRDCGDCLDFCWPIKFNTTALSELTSKVNTFNTKLAPLVFVRNTSRNIENRTYERTVLMEHRREKALIYANLSKAEESIDELAGKIYWLKRGVNTSFDTEMAYIYNITATIKNKTDENDFLAAYYWLSELRNAVNYTRKKAENMSAEYNLTLSAKFMADREFRLALMNIPKDDVVAEIKFDELSEQKSALDSQLSSPIPPDMVKAVRVQYDTIAGRAAELQRKSNEDEKHSFSTALSAVGRGVIDVFYFLPLDHRIEVRLAPLLIPLLIILADGTTILASVGAFFLLVRNRMLILHRTAKILWTLIFISLFVMLLILSVAVFVIIHGKSGTTTISDFAHSLKKNTVIVVDQRGADASTTSSMLACANRISSTIANLSSSSLAFVDASACRYSGAEYPPDYCTDGNENSVIILKTSATNMTNFYTFYEKKAVAEGDKAYFEECFLADALTTVIQR